MKLKSLAAVAAATLSLASFDVLACSTAAWIADGGGTGVVGTPVAAEPDDTPVAVARYANRCGLLADQLGDSVIDGTPSAESSYRARFYVAATNTGNAVVFRARNASSADMITVESVGGTAFRFTVPTSGGPVSATSAATVAGRWYSIELAWAAGGQMTATIQGNGSATPLATVTVPTAPAVIDAAARIDSAQLGWVAGGAGGPVLVDAFESRRQTAIGRLCRGDANNDNNINVGDRVVITNEILGSSLGSGQPDVNEDTTVNAGDRVALGNLILASATCN